MLLLLVLLQCIPMIEENVDPPDHPTVYVPEENEEFLEVSIVGGGISTLSSQDAYSISPTAEVDVEAKLGENEYLPKLGVRTKLSSLPEEELSLEDATTFKSIEFEAGFEQPIPNIYPKLYAGFGIATRLPGDSDPRINAAKYFTIGVLFITDSRDSYLYVGGGPDQRLNPEGFYQGCAQIEGRVKLAQYKDGKLFLKGDAILGGTSSLVRVGVVIGI